MPWHRDGQALGYVVRGPSGSVYFAGDTGVFDGMSEFGPVDVALLPVSGWGPRLPAGHMGPEEAAEAVGLIHPRVAIPIHWGTYERMAMRADRPERERRARRSAIRSRSSRRRSGRSCSSRARRSRSEPRPARRRRPGRAPASQPRKIRWTVSEPTTSPSGQSRSEGARTNGKLCESAEAAVRADELLERRHLGRVAPDRAVDDDVGAVREAVGAEHVARRCWGRTARAGPRRGPRPSRAG